MNILHINSHDLHGARFNGYEMQKIIGLDHNVEMAVWEKTSTNSNVHIIPPNNQVLRYLTNIMISFTSRLGFDRLFGYSGLMLPLKNYFKKADIVHLHLIHNNTNFSILSLPKLSRKKIIFWTLHDPWAFTGGCEHSFDCDKWQTGCNAICPYPRAKSIFQSYAPFFHWKLKKYLYSNSEINLIVASQWMKDRVSVSPLLKHMICHLIPFGIDINLFFPHDKLKARKKLGIDTSNRVIAFRDSGYKIDKFKGMKWLMEALQIFQPEVPTTLLIFQDGEAFEILSDKYSVKRTGWVSGEEMSWALSAADIFLMPSIQESFGLMAIEAMACGLPVVVFEGSALPSIIKAPIGGIAVPAKNSNALAETIKQLLDDEILRLQIGKQARNLVETDYTDVQYVKKHIEVYKSAICNYSNKNKKN
jgi:glycosyltransferase involved in cell wall biosynthesis